MLLQETLKTIGELARKVKNNPATVNRWITRGIVLQNGERLRLEAQRLGGRWLTSEEALGRFMAAQNPNSTPTPTSPTDPPRKPPRARKPAAERVAEELKQLLT